MPFKKKKTDDKILVTGALILGFGIILGAFLVIFAVSMSLPPTISIKAPIDSSSLDVSGDISAPSASDDYSAIFNTENSEVKIALTCKDSELSPNVYNNDPVTIDQVKASVDGTKLTISTESKVLSEMCPYNGDSDKVKELFCFSDGDIETYGQYLGAFGSSTEEIIYQVLVYTVTSAIENWDSLPARAQDAVLNSIYKQVYGDDGKADVSEMCKNINILLSKGQITDKTTCDFYLESNTNCPDEAICVNGDEDPNVGFCGYSKARSFEPRDISFEPGAIALIDQLDVISGSPSLDKNLKIAISGYRDLLSDLIALEDHDGVSIDDVKGAFDSYIGSIGLKNKEAGMIRSYVSAIITGAERGDKNLVDRLEWSLGKYLSGIKISPSDREGIFRYVQESVRSAYEESIISEIESVKDARLLLRSVMKQAVVNDKGKEAAVKIYGLTSTKLNSLIAKAWEKAGTGKTKVTGYIYSIIYSDDPLGTWTGLRSLVKEDRSIEDYTLVYSVLSEIAGYMSGVNLGSNVSIDYTVGEYAKKIKNLDLLVENWLSLVPNKNITKQEIVDALVKFAIQVASLREPGDLYQKVDQKLIEMGISLAVKDSAKAQKDQTYQKAETKKQEVKGNIETSVGELIAFFTERNPGDLFRHVYQLYQDGEISADDLRVAVSKIANAVMTAWEQKPEVEIETSIQDVVAFISGLNLKDSYEKGMLKNSITAGVKNISSTISGYKDQYGIDIKGQAKSILEAASIRNAVIENVTLLVSWINSNQPIRSMYTWLNTNTPVRTASQAAVSYIQEEEPVRALKTTVVNYLQTNTPVRTMMQSIYDFVASIPANLQANYVSLQSDVATYCTDSDVSADPLVAGWLEYGSKGLGMHDIDVCDANGILYQASCNRTQSNLSGNESYKYYFEYNAVSCGENYSCVKGECVAK